MSGGGGSGGGSTTTIQQQVPPFLEDAYKQGIARADSVSNGAYVPYAGQRIAGFSAPTQQSFNMTQQGIGNYQPALNAATGITANAATPFNADTFQQFMNPYTSQVTDEIGRLGNKNFSENLLPQINDQFTGGGMFGSTRNALTLGRAAEATQQDITGQQSKALADAFQNSMGNYNTAMGRSLQAGSQLGNLAQEQQTLHGNDVNALRGIGQTQENQQQTLLDTAYNQFLEQRDYPEAQASFFNSIVRGLPTQGLVQSQRQTLATPAAGNPIQSAIGSVGALLNGQQAAMKRGGSVRAKKMKVKRSAAKPSHSMGIGGGMAYA